MFEYRSFLVGGKTPIRPTGPEALGPVEEAGGEECSPVLALRIAVLTPRDDTLALQMLGQHLGFPSLLEVHWVQHLSKFGWVEGVIGNQGRFATVVEGVRALLGGGCAAVVIAVVVVVGFPVVGVGGETVGYGDLAGKIFGVIVHVLATTILLAPPAIVEPPAVESLVQLSLFFPSPAIAGHTLSLLRFCLNVDVGVRRR